MDETEPRASSSSRSFAIGCLLAILIPLGLALDPFLDYWTATRDESYSVTGVVPVRRGRDVYFVVSGHSERTTETSSGNNRRSTHTTAFPRLTTFRGSDGRQVAMRQYAPLPRFEYVDTVVRALLAEDGRVWVMSTERDVGLHAVDPVSLEDVVPLVTLRGRLPALSAGVYVEPGTSESPVVARGHELFFRLNSGATVALEPESLSLRELPNPDEDDVEDLAGPEPRGDPAVEAWIRGRPGVIDPRVVPVFDLEGDVDTSASYVVSTTSLDRQAARVVVSRFDTTQETPTPGFRTTLPGVSPECCALRAVRYDGTVVLWYEHWLVALDDSNGALRWLRRL